MGKNGGLPESDSRAPSISGHADVYVRGYVTRNGTYVAPHYRSSPNSTTLDNYSTRGNYNPHTGEPGYKDPWSSSYGGSGSLLDQGSSDDGW